MYAHARAGTRAVWVDARERERWEGEIEDEGREGIQRERELAIVCIRVQVRVYNVRMFDDAHLMFC